MKRDNATDNSSAPSRAAVSVTRRSDLGFPVVVILIFLLAELGGAPVRDAFRYESNWLTSGDGWRLITGHFVHLGWSHFLMNAAGLMVMFLVFADNTARDGALRLWWVPTLLSSIAISLQVMAFAPELHWYVGFSGVLHTLIVVALFRCRVNWPPINWWLLVVALVSKLIYEAGFGALPGSAETAGGPVAVQAHIAGAVFGLLYGVLWSLIAYVADRT